MWEWVCIVYGFCARKYHMYSRDGLIWYYEPFIIFRDFSWPKKSPFHAEKSCPSSLHFMKQFINFPMISERFWIITILGPYSSSDICEKDIRHTYIHPLCTRTCREFIMKYKSFCICHTMRISHSSFFCKNQDRFLIHFLSFFIFPIYSSLYSLIFLLLWRNISNIQNQKNM